MLARAGSCRAAAAGRHDRAPPAGVTAARCLCVHFVPHMLLLQTGVASCQGVAVLLDLLLLRPRRLTTPTP